MPHQKKSKESSELLPLKALTRDSRSRQKISNLLHDRSIFCRSLVPPTTKSEVGCLQYLENIMPEEDEFQVCASALKLVFSRILHVTFRAELAHATWTLFQPRRISRHVHPSISYTLAWKPVQWTAALNFFCYFSNQCLKPASGRNPFNGYCF